VALVAHAQQAERVRRVGVLMSTTAGNVVAKRPRAAQKDARHLNPTCPLSDAPVGGTGT
jgi:hypothetical protein